MSTKAEYRPLFVGLRDDPDFHAMSGNAAKLYFVLKLSLRAIGMGMIYPSTLCDQVGVDRATLDALFHELEAPRTGRDLGWIVRERNMVWIVDGLADEKTLSPANIEKHVPFVRELVSAINATLPIVGAFKRHYRQWFVGEQIPEAMGKPTRKVSEGNENPLDSLPGGHREGSDTLSKPRDVAVDLAVAVDRDLKRETTVAVAASQGIAADSAPRVPTTVDEQHQQGSASLFESKSEEPKQLPMTILRVINRFLDRYYVRGSATKKRRGEVYGQIVDTLSRGALLRAGEVVFAGSQERLEAKIREVLDGPAIRKKDCAIAVLLIKLGDRSDMIDEQRQRIAVAFQREEEAMAAESLAAESWVAEQPTRSTMIDTELERETRDLEDGPMAAQCREYFRHSLVMTAWRRGTTTTNGGKPPGKRVQSVAPS